MGSKNKGIRKSEFVAKTQFLFYHYKNPIYIQGVPIKIGIMRQIRNRFF